jgi:hypothetical protein
MARLDRAAPPRMRRGAPRSRLQASRSTIPWIPDRAQRCPPMSHLARMATTRKSKHRSTKPLFVSVYLILADDLVAKMLDMRKLRNLTDGIVREQATSFAQPTHVEQRKDGSAYLL